MFGMMGAPARAAGKNGPSLVLDFTRGFLDPRVVVTRASAGMSALPGGQLVEVAANQPRFGYDAASGELGLLSEEARTNLLSYPRQFDNSAWLKSTMSIVPNVTLAPDGTLSADKMFSQNAVQGYIGNTITATAGQTYTLSICAKAAERTKLILLAYGTYFGGGANVGMEFDLVGGAAIVAPGCVATPSSKMESMGGGWYRCSITINCTTTTTGQPFQIRSSENGDGSSGIYLWHAQLEAGAFATSPIPDGTTFTSRASSKWEFNAAGVLTQYGNDVAVTAYDPATLVSRGLSLEAQATNLAPSSEDLTASTGTAVTANVMTAPTGLVTADLLTELSTSGEHYAADFSYAVTAGTKYVFSAFVKDGPSANRYFYLRIAAGAVAGFYFNPRTKTISGINGPDYVASGYEEVGNGWSRVWIVYNAPASVSVVHRIQLYNGVTSNYIGDGASGMYVWGRQLEVGERMTSYIPTAGASATRAADVSSSPQVTRAADNNAITNLSHWFNAAEGTLYANFIGLAVTNDDIGRVTWALGDSATFNESMYLARDSNALTLTNHVVDGGVNQAAMNVGSLGQEARAAFGYAANNFAVAMNGAAPTTDSVGTVPTPNILALGKASWGLSNHMNGTINRIEYYPRRLTNAELQALTA